MSFAFVLTTTGVFGGAERRFTNLFFYLDRKYKGKFYFIVSRSLIKEIKDIFPGNDCERIIAIDINEKHPVINGSAPEKSVINLQINKVKPKLKQLLIYRLYYFLRTRAHQRKLFKQILSLQKTYGIISFIGIFNGIIPLYFFFTKKKTRPAVIFSDMDSWFMNISPAMTKEWYTKYTTFNYGLSNCDLVDFLSPFILNGVRERGIEIPDEKARITKSSFTDYSKCRIGKKDIFRVAFSGRLEKDKNPVLFLEAAMILATQYPDVEFHILGEGRLSNEVRKIINQSGSANIKYYGFHPNPPEIFAETSVFVSIQTANNYPSQSVLEAMACGNAIIATDVGDTRIFVNENNGTLIPLDQDALVQSIRGYIENPGLAKEKGLFAASYVRKEFTIEKAADYYLDLFENGVRKIQQQN